MQEVTRIEINQKIPFLGDGDTLESRLRTVTLRGFPEVAIYKDAEFEPVTLTAQEVMQQLSTPQPHVHQAYLDRIMVLAELFAAKDIDLFHLDATYDYTAYAPSGEATRWTMLPPVVERFAIPRHAKGGFDYEPLLADTLREVLTANDWQINPATQTAPYYTHNGTVDVINDGSHRVHAGVLAGKGVTVLRVRNITPGYPYYAMPQDYALVQVFPKEETSRDLKVHVITEPGHKQLYRLFPSGGILSGSVRPAREGERIV